MRRVKPAKCCQECYAMLYAPDDHDVQDREKLIALKTRGFLLVPSKELYEIIYQVICGFTLTSLHRSLVILFPDLMYTQVHTFKKKNSI